MLLLDFGKGLFIETANVTCLLWKVFILDEKENIHECLEKSKTERNGNSLNRARAVCTRSKRGERT